MSDRNLNNIYHFTTNLNGGGAETQMLLLASSKLIQKNFNNIIVFKTANDLDFFKDKYRNIKFLSFDNFVIPKGNSLFHVWIPDVLTYFPFYKFDKNKTIIGVRNVYSINSLKRAYQFFSFLFFNRFISNSPFVLQRIPFKYVFIKKKFNYIPNGIKFKLKKIDSEKKKISFLYVGRLVKQKGIDTLIEVLKKDEEFKITIVGDGPLKSMLEIVKKQVTFIGYSQQISTFYEESKFLVLPSFTEGMPNVVLESICFGVIPILSDIPQHKQLFSDNKEVIFFKVGDAKSLENAILKARNLSQFEIEVMTLNLKKVLSKFNTVTMIEKYFNYYDELFKKN